MRVFYIRGTKKFINEQAKLQNSIPAVEYTPHDTHSIPDIRKIKEPVTVKFWKNRIGGTPIAQSYGVWEPTKNKIV
jgi:hypothetical protein